MNCIFRFIMSALNNATIARHRVREDRTYIFISDVHLGSKFSKTELLQNFLKAHYSPKLTLVLLGDIYDLWKLKKPQMSIAEFIHPDTEVIFLPGNHDYEFTMVSDFKQNLIVNDAIVFEPTPDTAILASHGHRFDPSFGNPFNFITRLKDLILYQIAMLLNIDFRHRYAWARGLSLRYYNNVKYYDTVARSCKELNTQCSVTGHTHAPGTFSESEVLHFNTGSWLYKPAALFIRGGKYVLHMVEEQSLRPAEVSFKDFR